MQFDDSVDVNSSDVSITTKILKHGSYYVGYEAQHNGKQYIAKKVDTKNMISKKLLKQERKLLVYLKHPHVAQQLAVFGCPKSPILLMERMWMSLGEFIVNDQSHHDKISILHDTACGLQYIHEQGIIHCDLTAESILLTEKVTAKLADFGQAFFCRQTMTMKYFSKIPDHLPPEVLKPYPMTSYSTKVDIFSFGCVMIHTFTQEHPTPDLDKYVETSEVGKYRHNSEIERRSVCLKKFTNNCNSQELCNLMLNCLQDDTDYRPTAETLCSLLKKQLIPFTYGMCNVAVNVFIIHLCLLFFIPYTFNVFPQ